MTILNPLMIPLAYVRRPLGRDLKESASPVGTRFAIDAVEQAPQGLVKGKIMKRNKFQLKGGSAPLTLVGLFATCWLYPATGLPPQILPSCDPGSTIDFCYSSPPAAVMGLRAFSGTGSGEIYVDPTG